MASPMSSVKSSGMRMLLAFSIPLDTPRDMMSSVATAATTTHMLAPQALAVSLNMPAMTSMSCPMANRSPSNAMTVYLMIHATTHVYPMASARDPITGISPMRSPTFLLPKRRSVHIPKAPQGPALAARPRANSPMTPVAEIRTTKIR